MATCNLQYHTNTNNIKLWYKCLSLIALSGKKDTSIFDYLCFVLLWKFEQNLILKKTITLKLYILAILGILLSTGSNAYQLLLLGFVTHSSTLWQCSTRYVLVDLLKHFFTKLSGQQVLRFNQRIYCIIIENKDELESRHKSYRSSQWLSCNIQFLYHSVLLRQLQTSYL